LAETESDRPVEIQEDAELERRAHFIAQSIKLVQASDDPRAPDAVKRLRDQQENVNREIRRRANERGLPPETKVQLKPAIISVKASQIRG
jgi:hypothetical protein